MSKKLQPVLVTTTERGIYFGWTDDPNAEIIRLERCRHVFHYTRNPERSHRGVYGLATVGPHEGSKVGPPVSVQRIRNIQNVVDVDEVALPSWESISWE